MGTAGANRIKSDWEAVVLRARLGKQVTLVALAAATYANADGTKVFPGVARLAVECEVDYRTVRRALKKLRDLGLLVLVKRGNRRRKQSDEYRLAVPDDLLERCKVLSPDEVREQADAVEGQQASYHRSRDHRSPETCKEADYRSGPTPITGHGCPATTHGDHPGKETTHEETNTSPAVAYVEEPLRPVDIRSRAKARRQVAEFRRRSAS